MPKFRVLVTETREVQVACIVEANSRTEASDKACNGNRQNSLREDDVTKAEVVRREFVDITTLPEIPGSPCIS